MGYTAGSFTAGQQPTTAQWNVLWANDASFNDGTGIANLEIGSGHTSLKNDYKFSVYRNAAWTSGSPAKIAFDTKVYDTSSNFDIVTNNRFVATVAGYYFFSLNVGYVNSNGAIYSAILYKNGSPDKTGTQSVSNGVATNYAHVSGGIQLAANDYVEGWGYGSNNTGVTGSTATWMTGYLVSQT